MKDQTKRNTEMAQMKRDGNTLQVIADKYGVTRQRVEQILAKTGETFPNQAHQKHPEKYFGMVCSECGTIGQKLKTHLMNTRNGKPKKNLFCDLDCYYLYLFKNRATDVEKIAYRRRKTREWYNNIYSKHPKFKEMVARRNRGESFSIHDYDNKA